MRTAPRRESTSAPRARPIVASETAPRRNASRHKGRHGARERYLDEHQASVMIVRASLRLWSRWPQTRLGAGPDAISGMVTFGWTCSRTHTRDERSIAASPGERRSDAGVCLCASTIDLVSGCPRCGNRGPLCTARTALAVPCWGCVVQYVRASLRARRGGAAHFATCAMSTVWAHYLTFPTTREPCACGRPSGRS